MGLVGFRHKGLRQLHEVGSAKGLPSSMADKLGKLLFDLETAETIDRHTVLYVPPGSPKPQRMPV